MSQKTEDYKRWLNALIHRLRVAPVGSTYPLDPLERELALNEIERLTAENERLRGEVRQLGEMGDVCTFVALGEICGGCRCVRRVTQQQAVKED